MTFAKPEIGSEIEITTNTPNLALPLASNQQHRGKVVTAFKWVGEHDFCLTTGDSAFAVRVIDIRHVTEMKYVDGFTAETVELKPVPPIESWTVTGSKGDVYIITRDSDKWSCDCVAGRFNRHCKHVSQIQSTLA